MENSIESKYEFIKEIGQGSYATVYKAINKETRETCAIKKLSIASDTRSLTNEIKIMTECDCKNIVRLLTSSLNDGAVFIVMEYCCGGSVKDVMKQLRRTLTEQQITVIIKDVLSGLDFLHSKGKIHRDVKAANILLNEEGIAKLADFGVSDSLDSIDRVKGTLLWLPPEVLLTLKQNYSCVIDIWSLGITIIEMGESQPPNSGISVDVALKEIADLEKPAPTFREPSNWSFGLNDFLELCLKKDVTERKSARELLNHSIIKKAPRNDIIKSLVAEVCSATSDGNSELKTSLYQTSKHLLKQINLLFGTLDERRMKVIKVDQKGDALKSITREFKMLEEKRLSRDASYNKMRAQAKDLENELARMKAEIKELKSTLDGHFDRKRDIEKHLIQLQGIIHKESKIQS